MIDTGIDETHAEFIGKIHAASVDIYDGTHGFDPASVGSTPRNHLDDEDGHGTGVASAAAAAKLPDDDPLLAGPGPAGMHGVAFDSTILAIRADDNDPACNPTPGCDFESPAVVAAIDYAVDRGANIINLSLGSDSGVVAGIHAAIDRAIRQGIDICSPASITCLSVRSSSGVSIVRSRPLSSFTACSSKTIVSVMREIRSN